MSENPYEAPRGSTFDAIGAASIAPPYKLYQVNQIGIAAFIGAPIAGCWFMAKNFTRLGDSARGIWWLIGGTIATAIAIGIGFVLPENFPSQFIAIGYLVALIQLAKSTQGEALAKHKAAGGEFGSWGEVVGMSLLFLIGLLAMIFGAVVVFVA